MESFKIATGCVLAVTPAKAWSEERSKTSPAADPLPCRGWVLTGIPKVIAPRTSFLGGLDLLEVGEKS